MSGVIDKNLLIDVLPSRPTSLSFNPDEFMKSDFSVDKFIASHRHIASLETIRDDLGMYLKLLRSAMIELINQDYADFVNLSTNLVGMDKGIARLQNPLELLRVEVLNVKTALDVVISDLEEKLKLRREIENQKAFLQRLRQILISLNKIEELLKIDKNTVRDSSELSGDVIERAATELNLLHFHIAKCQGADLVNSVKPRVSYIGSILQSSLEESFINNLKHSGNLESLRRCLRIYATVDKIAQVEKLFRCEIIAPYLEEIISENAIRSDPQGLKGMFDNILNFVPQQCKLLQEATRGSPNCEPIEGYDFVVNTVWPEIVDSLEKRAISIYNPGNPNSFHEKYLISMRFLDKYEKLCGSLSSVKRLRKHPSYFQFMNKWNLAVYYQIRYQEIAGNFEKSLNNPWAEPSHGGIFQLVVTCTLWTCLNTCWDDGVFLYTLTHRFWKLCLQLLSRYRTWILEMTKLFSLTMDSSFAKEDASGFHVSASTPNLLKHNGGDLVKTQSSPNLHDPSHLSGLLKLVLDIQHLEHKMQTFLRDVVTPQLPEAVTKEATFMQDNLTESVNGLRECISPITERIVQDVSSQCLMFLKQVSDIPRLYRRTNREAPTKPSHYVTAILAPLLDFLQANEAIIMPDHRCYCINSIVMIISKQYFVIANEVLISIQKIGQSLKQLKRVREKTTGESRGMSDDDKARQQLRIDITDYVRQVEDLGVDSDMQSLKKLQTLTESRSTVS